MLAASDLEVGSRQPGALGAAAGLVSSFPLVKARRINPERMLNKGRETRWSNGVRLLHFHRHHRHPPMLGPSLLTSMQSVSCT